MALTAQDISSTGRLAQLAADPQGASHDEIYVAIASLYRAQGPYLSDRERTLMREIMQRLSRDVEMAVRITLAERFADDDETPTDLILMLCDDEIEIARPVIMRSRRLSDAEILKFIHDASGAHQAAIAARPNIGESVTEILSKSEFETVLVALVLNTTAHIGMTAFESLVQKSKKLESLHGPLAARHDVPLKLAQEMCNWVSDALKDHIKRNFQIPDAKTEAALAKTRQALWSAQQVPTTTDSSDSARKLVEKLHGAGQLKAGFLLRVLNQNQIELFDHAFAKILGLELKKFRQIFYEHGPRAVAMACRAAGIDRSVFATVFNLSRQSHALTASISPEERVEVEMVFNALTKASASADIQATNVPAAG